MRAVAFESTTGGAGVCVGPWAICENGDIYTGEGIESLFERLLNGSGVIFDLDLSHRGHFYIDYLLRNGFKWSGYKWLRDREFSTLVTNRTEIYKISICFKTSHKKGQTKIIEIRDASKKLAATIDKVEDIAAAFYVPYDAAKSPIINEVTAVDKSISEIFSRGLTALTISSDALEHYQRLVGIKNFHNIFKPIDADTEKFLRRAYRGGLCLINAEHRGHEVNDIDVYDTNSAYPFQMVTMPMPYGAPHPFFGAPPADPLRPAWIAYVKICFKLKCDGVPVVQSAEWFNNEYITDTRGMLIDLYITEPDYQSICENYDIQDIKFVSGYSFRVSENLFKDYVAPLYAKKMRAANVNREIAKLLLNGLYGKMAGRSVYQQLVPVMHDNVLDYVPGEVSRARASSAIAAAAYITAYQRAYLAKAIKANLSAFVYCDTDSLHLMADAGLNGLEIDDTRIGAFKHECAYSKATYYKQKMYVATRDTGETECHMAGIPLKNTRGLTYENIVNATTLPTTFSTITAGGLSRHTITKSISK